MTTMMNSTSLELGFAPAAPGLPGAAPPPVPGAPSPDFAQAMADLLAASVPTAPAKGDPLPRQDAAVTGKDVPLAPTPALVAAIPPDCVMLDPDLLPALGPDDPPIGVDAADPDDPDLEPELAWLMPVLAPTPAPVSSPRLPAAALPPALLGKGAPAQPAVATLPPVAPAAPDAGDCAMPAPSDEAPSGPAAVAGPTERREPSLDAQARLTDAKRPVTPGFDLRDAAGQRAEAPAIVAPDKAGMLAAAAAHRLAPVPATRLVAPTVAIDPAAPLHPDTGLLVSATTAASAAPPVSAALQPGLDLTRDPGLHRMIDRIEQLRDSADVRETRIRLIPDALGPVDIAVRREGAGDGVQVHFTAAEATTRQLLAEAQHRLTELADARGVRIERAIIDGGAAGDGQSRPQPQRTDTSQPRAPARAGREAEPETTDQRIA